MGLGVLLALGVLSAQAGGPELKKISLPCGTTLAYKTWGSGPIPVVYVHGYSLSMATWDRIFNRVPARYTNFASICAASAIPRAGASMTIRIM